MNDPEIIQYLESRFHPQSLERIREFVETQNKNDDVIFFSIILKQGDQHIGNIKLGPINRIHRFGDIGIVIGDKSCWGQGYATEAIGLVVDYGFQILNLNKLTAGCYSNNSGSLKAFQKNGFEIEGVRKQQYFCNNEYVDDIILGKLNPKKGDRR
jgi:[ribosomal protein S5]-alanine N-acetyltransferase